MNATTPSTTSNTLISSGLAGTAVAATRLSFIDGARGELLIAGYGIEDLAPQTRFEDVVHLLWHDRLPSSAERKAFAAELAALRPLPCATLELLAAAAAARLHSMDALRMATATLSLDDPAGERQDRAAQLQRAGMLLARMPVMVAAYARLLQGKAVITPDAQLAHAENYLYMLDGERPTPSRTAALETYLNTVVDHGMNASTFAARVIISTRSDMVSAIVGAIGALKGPLHGGAPGPALDMVFAIRERAARNGRPLRTEAEEHLRRVLARGERIMGFGHRVYRVRDPRADVLGAAAERLFAAGGDTQLYRDAREVESVVLRALREAKPDRRLDTNVEFYTALLLHGIGLPADLFSPTFAIARAGGWTAHVLEQLDDDHLIRPDAVYVGARDRRVS